MEMMVVMPWLAASNIASCKRNSYGHRDLHTGGARAAVSVMATRLVEAV